MQTKNIEDVSSYLKLKNIVAFYDYDLKNFCSFSDPRKIENNFDTILMINTIEVKARISDSMNYRFKNCEIIYVGDFENDISDKTLIHKYEDFISENLATLDKPVILISALGSSLNKFDVQTNLVENLDKNNLKFKSVTYSPEGVLYGFDIFKYPSKIVFPGLFNKKMKKNEGELPQFYVENSHPAIVSKEIFDMAQSEMQRRKGVGLRNGSAGIFSAKIICGDCDSFFGSKVWHSNTKYRRRVWQCRHKFKSAKKCKTPHFTEDQLKDLFLKAFNQIISDKDNLLSDCEMILTMFTDFKELDKKIDSAKQNHDNALKLIEAHINENAKTKLNQKQYKSKHQAYFEQYEKEKTKLENLQNIKIERKIKAQKIKAFIDQITENGDLITEFNEELFFATVEKITVNVDKSAVFTFKNGTEITI